MSERKPLDLENLGKWIDSNILDDSYLRELLIKEIKQRIKKACEFYLRYKDKPDSLAKEHPEYRQIIVLNFNTLCLNCKKELGEVCIRTWVGWDDGDYDYFCSEKCAEEYKKHLPKTKNILVPTHEEYNEWLFKLAFKDVFEKGEKRK